MKYLESEFSLEGRRIIVTGAGGLLGSSFSISLGRAGAELHLLDIDSDALAKLKSNLSSEATKASYYEADITDKVQVTSVIDSIAESGSINGLVNSAALDPKFDLTTAHSHSNPTAFSSYSLDNWRQSLEVNLTGTFLVTQAVCKHVEQDVAQDCSIINIASTYGITGPDQRIYEDETPERFFKPLDYSVTKAGVLGFTRALAAYYRETGIRVNSLSPGGAFKNHDPEFVKRYSLRTILGRMARDDEYGAAIVFLSSKASSYMTGSNLVIDGGWTAL